MLKQATQLSLTALLFLAFSFTSAQGQVETLIEQGSEYLDEMASEPSYLGMARNHKFKGTPYVPADWHNGRIYFNNGKQSATLKLRYNAYDNELEFQQDNQVLALLPKLFKGFVMYRPGKSPLVFQKGFSSKEHHIGKKQLLQTFNSGQTRLVLHHDIMFHEGMTKEISSGLYVDEFIPKPQYYIALSDTDLKKVKLKRSSILDALPGDNDDLRSYARKNNLSFRDEADVAKIVKQYNKLLQ